MRADLLTRLAREDEDEDEEEEEEEDEEEEEEGRTVNSSQNN